MSNDEHKPTTDRRDFLKLAGATAAAATVAGCHRGDPYLVTKPDVPGASDTAMGEVNWVATTCGQCDAGCGLRARVYEGRVVRVTGNPVDHLGSGGSGPRGLASPQVLYDPDRVPGPMKRVAPKGAAAGGDGDWEAVTWEQVIEELGDHLMELREDERADALCVVTGASRGMTRDLLARFAEAVGTTSFLDGRAKGEEPARLANLLMQGVDEAPAHDWGAAELVVSLGAEPRSEALRRGSRRGRARYVHLGPASTVAARAADEFHLVRSGSFGALALGLAKVIVDAGLHDEAFLTERCSGWEAPGLATTLEELDLSEVVAATGLELEALERLGHELGASPAAFALCGTEAYQTAGGLEAAMAVQALNAVLGAIDRPGGVLTQRDAPTAAWPEVEPDEYAEVSLEVPPIWDGLFDAGDERVVAPIDLLPAALAAAPEGRIDTLFLHEINPLWSRPDAEAWRTALAAVPVVVSFSPFWDETSLACADWILPDHSFLERWERAGVRPDDGRALYALRQPTVEPLHGTMQTAELLIEWAKYLDEGPLEAFDWKDAKDLVKDEIIGVYKAKVGSIIESKGSTFLSAFYSAARWHDADYPYESWDDVLRTDSGKLELQPEGHADWAMGLASVTATGAASGDPERYPLLLVPFRPETYTEGSGANQPLLQELRLRRSDRPWTTQVDLHPLHAAEFGVTDGDPVLVTTPVGELRAIARLDEGVFPGELRVPRGGGHTACGRYAAGWGANVATVLSTETKDRFQRTAWIGTRCAIRRDEA